MAAFLYLFCIYLINWFLFYKSLMHTKDAFMAPIEEFIGGIEKIYCET